MTSARRSLLFALVLFALALVGAGTASADYTANVMADQPVAYWRLGELGGLTAFDSAPWHYDAQLVGTTPTGGALYTDPGNGAQSLDGSSKILSSQDWSWLGGAPASGGVRNHSFSLEFWMKPAVIDSRYLWVISEEDKAPVRQGWGVMLTQQPGQPIALSYERWADGAYVGGVVYRNDNAALKNAIDVGKWTYVVVNYDGDTTMGGQNKLRLYVNGVLVQTTTAQPANMVDITQPFRAGLGDDPASQPGYIGAIDELALYGGAIWDAAAHYKSAFIAPQNTAAPTLSGTAARGQTLTASTGTWTGGPAPTLTVQWQRCAADGSACANVSGATGTTYAVGDADAGSTLRANVTGANGGGSVSVVTPVTVLVHGLAPSSTAAPSISGTGNVGDALTAASGSWAGVPAPTFAYQWQRCNSAGALCSDIPGASGSTYTPTVTDAGTKLVVRVVASNFEGSATASSPAFAVSTTVSNGGGTTAAPANTAAPSISGNLVAGATLTAANGSWGGAPTSFSYQWQRCGTACGDIAGATAATYVAQQADVGAGLDVVVTATNASGSTSATSATTAPVQSGLQTPAPPTMTTAPSISGQPLEGATLTAAPGVWTGSPTGYAYQWQRCGSTCVDVATGATYTATTADVGSTLVVTVTATGPGGSASAASAPVGPVTAAAPVSTAPPVVSGTPVEGATLTATPGTWTGSNLSFAYQWKRCDSTCVDVATGASYGATSADVGSSLEVVVTATNAGGSASATSAQTAKIAAAAPVSTAAPVVSGTPVDGATVTATPGTWTGSNLVFSYDWQRCGTTCVDVAAGASYTATAADVGSTLQVVVTATNAGGTASATSAQTAKVAAAAPLSLAAPVVSGTPVDGGTLTATAGSWSGTAPIAYAYQWQRCGTTCLDVGTGSTYTATGGDVGSTLQVVVTATNAGGSATATSAPTAAVAATAPVSVAAPSVSGTPVDGGTLTATAGTWNGTAPLTLAYQWKRCDSTCVDVATGASYTAASADVGSTLEVVVTATNAGGTAAATSAPTAKVAAAAPVSATAPSVSGTPVDGGTLTATAGIWNGTAPIDFTFKWQRCGTTCVDVATGASYTATAADVASTLQVVVTATNAGGTATATSAQTAPVAAAAPVSTAVPVVTGTAVAGSTLTATAGTWNGTAPIGYGYQWKRCASDGSCADIPGATAASYVLAAADVDVSVAVTVTATNAGGSAVATSNVAGPVKAAAPVSKAAPVVSGTPVDGQTLTASTGTWDGTDPLTYSYAWQRCGATCATIDGATADSYAVTPADAGSTLRVVVTATNAAGSASAPSAAVGPVAGVAPTSTTVPTVSGTAAIGKTLTATAGTWSGTAPIATTYQWERCTTTCAPIAGATTQAYVVQAADYNVALRVDVTAKNVAGSTTASSTQTAVVADTIAPTLAISPVATGGISIAGWNVSLLLNVTVTASDAESGLAADPTCTVDGRATTLKDAGDGAWTLSVIAFGSHTVACAVADKAGNRTTASATVKPGGARELEQSLLTQVNKLLANASTRDAQKLAKVAADLSDALAAANWVDSNHLAASRGKVVFDDNKDAAELLVDLLKDKQSQVPDATSISMLLTIAQVDRVLAATAVSDAISARAAKGKTDVAKDELDKSDTDAVRGDTTSALAHFWNAWRQAQDK